MKRILPFILLAGCATQKMPAAVSSTSVVPPVKAPPFQWSQADNGNMIVLPNGYSEDQQIRIVWGDKNLVVVSPKWGEAGGACMIEKGKPEIRSGQLKKPEAKEQKAPEKK